MTSLRIIGSSPWDDLYPNVRYRVAQIQSMPGYNVTVDVAKQQPKKHVDQGLLGYLRYGMGTVRSVIGITWRARQSRSDLIYVTYPAPIVLLFLRLLRVQSHTQVYADFFISISETLINDRRKVRAGTLTAKVLVALERFSITGTTCIVDTKQNADHSASFLSLPNDQFRACPLALAPRADRPQSLPKAAADSNYSNSEEYAYFVGTLVPLQGAPTIISACLQSASSSDSSSQIQLIIRGVGQESTQVRELLAESDGSVVEWRDSLADSRVIEEEIDGARICIGIFGETEKAQRVIPFKIYQYLRAGRVVLTLDSPALRDLEQEFLHKHDAPSPFILAQTCDLEQQMSLYLSTKPVVVTELAERSRSAKLCFDMLLANDVGIACLNSIFAGEPCPA